MRSLAPTYNDPSNWEVVGATLAAAWLRKKTASTVDLTQATVGQEVYGLGTILSIEQIHGRWAVKTDAGTIREAERSTASRNTDSVPNSSILPSSQSVAPKTLPGNSGKFQKIVVQVQTALFTYGYYTAAIDGIVGPQTRVALSKMQSDYGLKVTGTVTPELLDALGIAAQ
ncbi:peptidoglycan-binding protein [Breoghania corrubedonensis]